MILDNPFTCSNGHNFRANAKIRARCPECGERGRRDFKAKAVEPKPDDSNVLNVPPNTTHIVTPTPEPEKPKHRKVVLLRQGRPTMPKSVKHQEKRTAKKHPLKAAAKTKLKSKLVSGGVVKSRKLAGVHLPKVRRMPGRTAVARHTQIPGQRSYADEMMARYGG